MTDGLGLLPGSACPHYDGESNRRPTYHRLVARKILPAGVAADDGAAVHYVGRTIDRCVASRPNAKGYRVGLRGGKLVEEPMETRCLDR